MDFYTSATSALSTCEMTSDDDEEVLVECRALSSLRSLTFTGAELLEVSWHFTRPTQSGRKSSTIHLHCTALDHPSQ